MTSLLTTTVLTALEIAGCLLAADFLAGLLHWVEDTYLVPGRNALLDRLIVQPNIEHHRKPGGIREGTYWETNCVTIAICAVAAAVCAAFRVHGWEVYFTLLVGSQSNQFHAWSHTSNPPRAVAWLRKIKLLQSAKSHAVHHKAPYGVRYCTTTPLLNPVLDGIGFWRGLERILERFGVKVVRATQARGGY